VVLFGILDHRADLLLEAELFLLECIILCLQILSSFFASLRLELFGSHLGLLGGLGLSSLDLGFSRFLLHRSDLGSLLLCKVGLRGVWLLDLNGRLGWCGCRCGCRCGCGSRLDSLRTFSFSLGRGRGCLRFGNSENSCRLVRFGSLCGLRRFHSLYGFDFDRRLARLALLLGILVPKKLLDLGLERSHQSCVIL